MDLRPFLLAALAGGLLAGCSGSSDDEEDDGIDLGPAPGFAALEARDAALESSIATALATEGFADPAALPTAGSATYEGTMEIATAGETAAPDRMIGELALAVDFDASSDPLTGTAGNFATPGDGRLGGALAIGNGTLDRGADPEGEATFGADVVGALTQGGTAIAVDGSLLGDFVGDDAGQATGTVEGVVTVGDEVEGFEGGFDAGRAD